MISLNPRPVSVGVAAAVLALLSAAAFAGPPIVRSFSSPPVRMSAPVRLSAPAAAKPTAAKSTTTKTHTTGQPNQSCGSATAPNTPGNAATAPGSAFNPSGKAGKVYAGQQPQNSRNPKSVSQYDVACSHQR